MWRNRLALAIAVAFWPLPAIAAEQIGVVLMHGKQSAPEEHVSLGTALANAGFVKHHAVSTPFAKDDYSRGVSGWTHWTAVLKETGNGQRWAVDSWIYANGENPAVVEVEKWFGRRRR